jgi:hypothetical protein
VSFNESVSSTGVEHRQRAATTEGDGRIAGTSSTACNLRDPVHHERRTGETIVCDESAYSMRRQHSFDEF